MDKKAFVLLIVITIIGISTLGKIFTSDLHFKEISKNLSETKEELLKANKANQEAQNKIDTLNIALKHLDSVHKEILIERDDLVIRFKNSLHKSSNEIKAIKHRRDSLNKLLNQ